MSTTTSDTSGNTAVMVLAVLIIAIIAVGAIYLMQDHRSSSQRVGDAITALPQGPAKAVDKLGDQPPAVNVKNNVKDAAKKAS
jgi:hypothetical protein